jgi:hypothetical protein
MADSSIKKAGGNRQNIDSGVGKRVVCPRCGQEGTLAVKEIPRKNAKYHAYYVRHYIPERRKILWHYYGFKRMEAGANVL